MSRLGLASLMAAAWIAGCTAPQATPGAPGWISGRLSLHIDASADLPARSLSTAFELRGGADRGELHLISPLGTQWAAARWAPGEAVLTTGEGERRFADADALAQAALGQPLPLAALDDWLSGRPWPGAPHRPLVDGFVQSGWRVTLTRLAEGRIEARREASPAVVARVQLDPGERMP